MGWGLNFPKTGWGVWKCHYPTLFNGLGIKVNNNMRTVKTTS